MHKMLINKEISHKTCFENCFFLLIRKRTRDRAGVRAKEGERERIVNTKTSDKKNVKCSNVANVKIIYAFDFLTLTQYG